MRIWFGLILKLSICKNKKILKTELLDCILSSVADCGILRQLGYAKDVMEALSLEC